MSRWADIQKELSGKVPAVRTRDTSVFWDDFRARAPMFPQHAPESPRSTALLRWSLAAACTLFLLTGVTMHTWRSGAVVIPNAITALDIATPYRAVFIMNDKQSGGTILWIDCDVVGKVTPGDML